MLVPLNAVLRALIWIQKAYVFASAIAFGAAIGLSRPSIIWIGLALLFSAWMLGRLRRQVYEDATKAALEEIISSETPPSSKGSRHD